MKRKQPAYAAFLIIGLAMISLAISVNIAFIGAGAVFVIIGAAGMAKERRAKKDNDKPADT